MGFGGQYFTWADVSLYIWGLADSNTYILWPQLNKAEECVFENPAQWNWLGQCSMFDISEMDWGRGRKALEKDVFTEAQTSPGQALLVYVARKPPWFEAWTKCMKFILSPFLYLCCSLPVSVMFPCFWASVMLSLSAVIFSTFWWSLSPSSPLSDLSSLSLSISDPSMCI